MYNLNNIHSTFFVNQAAKREKRAIQFGTRIAQASNRRDFGSNRKANKVNAGSRTVKDR